MLFPLKISEEGYPLTHHQVRVVVIGIGVIAQIHARAIGAIDQVRLVAASCRNKDKGAAFSEQFDCRWYRDNIEMLDRERPDVAIICTPSGTHETVAGACFDRRIHVLCEKPLEISVARIDRMIDRARQSGVRLGGIFPRRFDPAVSQVHQAVKAGRFGRPSLLASYVPWWRDDAYYAPDRWQGKLTIDGGGAMMNQAIHYVDLVQWLGTLAGAGPVVEVFGYTGRLGRASACLEAEDTAVAVLRFANGTLGQLLGATSAFPGSDARVLISGGHGTAEIVGGRIATWQFLHAGCHDATILERFVARETCSGSRDPAAIGHANHQRNIAEFIDALREGRPPAIDGHEARKSVAIIEAILLLRQRENAS